MFHVPLSCRTNENDIIKKRCFATLMCACFFAIFFRHEVFNLCSAICVQAISDFDLVVCLSLCLCVCVFVCVCVNFCQSHFISVALVFASAG